ncbi:3-oxoacyl-[acyl-carrier-protein] reductase [soil metagenome]
MAIALITGGEGTLASALHRELSTEGYEIHAPGKGVLDVTETLSIQSYMAKLPRLDLLVCTAGLIADKPMSRMEDDDFSKVLEVCLSGAFRTARAALKLMSKQKQGHIVFIGSFSAWRGPIGQANYAAAKAGLFGLAESLAKEYGSRNIRVNVILPGFMETKMTASLTESKREEYRQTHALGRFNTPTETARFIAFLDQHLPHTSGQIFNLDSRVHRCI